MSEKLPIVHGTMAVQYFAPLRAEAVKAMLVPVGLDATANGKCSWRQSNVDHPGCSLATMELSGENSRSMSCYLYVCTG